MFELFFIVLTFERIIFILFFCLRTCTVLYMYNNGLRCSSDRGSELASSFSRSACMHPARYEHRKQSNRAKCFHALGLPIYERA